jgi:zinc protease
MQRYLLKHISITLIVTVVMLCFAKGVMTASAEVLDEQHFTPPAIRQFNLADGVKVFFKEDPELPTFSLSLYLPRGSLSRTLSNAAVYSALSYLWRHGGAGALSADELDTRLEHLSASIGVNVNDEYIQISCGGLISEREEILQLTKDVLFAPRFDEERLLLWKMHMLDGIKKRSDTTDTIAGLSFVQLLYRGTILGQPLRDLDVKQVTASAVEELYMKLFSLESAVVGVSGALTKEQVRQDVVALLKQEVGISLAPHEHVKLDFKPMPGVFFVEKTFPQATVYIGQRGPKRFVDDYAAIEVFNGIFGSDGAFSSMLTKELRTQRGLTYSVAGGIYRDEPIGRNFIGFQTKSASVGDGITAAMNTLRAMKSGAFTEQQLADVKTAARNSFIFRYDSIPEIVQRRALMEILHYPSSYEETFLAKIDAVTKQDVVAVANRYWKEEELMVLVVGDRSAYQSLGKVRNQLFARDPNLKKLSLKTLQFSTELLIK